MPNTKNPNLHHFLLQNSAISESFKPNSFPQDKQVVTRNQQAHGQLLLNQIALTKSTIVTALQEQKTFDPNMRVGTNIEIQGFPNMNLLFGSLVSEAKGIELRNIRHDNNTTLATIFVPENKIEILEKKIIAFKNKKLSNKGKSQENKPLVNSISSIHFATFSSLWTDDNKVLPSSLDEAIWWEAWLSVEDDTEKVINSFRAMARKLQIAVSTKVLRFPERSVLNMFASTQTLMNSLNILNMIAEIRRAKETAEFFDSLPNVDQNDWLADMMKRTQINDVDANTPYICFLDTGVNISHPALQPFITHLDAHSINSNWGTNDDEGHGTSLAGLGMYGDMTEHISSTSSISINHRLESVKLLPHGNFGQTEPYGAITAEAVARPQISFPNRHRVYNLAVTTPDGRDKGKPSAWSSAIDNIVFDSFNDGENPQLVVISAGNTDCFNNSYIYPDYNIKDPIHDPGQAWNAITVGACTNKIKITEPHTSAYAPLAKANSLSPTSTTSLDWKSLWPLKPDVVFEGGNIASDGSFNSQFASLSLLTSHHEFTRRLLTTTNATSAASALCSRMAAQIMSSYPRLWPETVRALIIVSASWTKQMKADFLNSSNKGDYARLVRHCGFGEPSLAKAIWSASNSLTLISQDFLKPFKVKKGKRGNASSIVSGDMNTHTLPWPKDLLLSLGDTEVTMRVTLSYFIEANPGVCERGVNGRYQYESHGLRFDVKRPTETITTFKGRINNSSRDENYSGGGGDDGWLIGPNARHRGSIHADIWNGTAADLAERGVIAVYPVTGWWKTAKKLDRFNRKVRYSLVVSITTPESNIDIYSAVKAKIDTATVIQT